MHAGVDQVVLLARPGPSAEGSAMNDNDPAAREWDRALERLAAEATTTAYAVALRYGVGGSWVELELGLWEALARTVREWGRRMPGSEPTG